MAAATTAGQRGRAADTQGKATKADQAALRKRARAGEREQADAYKLGQADRQAGHRKGHRAPLEPDLEDLYNSGYDDEASKGGPASGDQAGQEKELDGRPRRLSGAGPSSGGGGSSLSITEDGAGFLVGILGYALVLNYLRYGWPGVTGWLSAKFTNKVTLGGGGKGQGPGSPNTVLIPNANPAAGSRTSPVPVPQTGAVALT